MKKNWLITGVSSGIGKALAEKVIDEGDFVVATFRKEKEVQQFNETFGEEALGIQLDLTEIDKIDEKINEVLNQCGQIDVLVNNAGVGFVGAIEEASIAEVRKVFEVNLFGTLKITQSVLSHMRVKKEGYIIQISSHAGVKAFAGFGIYNASKFALEGFSEALAQEVKPLNIKLMMVEPGPFRTNFAGPSLLQSEKQIDDYAETAGAFRNKLLNVHNKQEGDPVKAAAIIVDQVLSDDIPLRLPLGKIPLTTINMKIESLKSDLEKNREKSAQAVFEN